MTLHAVKCAIRSQTQRQQMRLYLTEQEVKNNACFNTRDILLNHLKISCCCYHYHYHYCCKCERVIKAVKSVNFEQNSELAFLYAYGNFLMFTQTFSMYQKYASIQAPNFTAKIIQTGKA